MIRAHRPPRHTLPLALAGLVLALATLAPAAPARAGVYGGLGPLGRLTVGESGEPAEVRADSSVADGLAVDTATGDYFIADVLEKSEEVEVKKEKVKVKHHFARVQEFGPKGEFLAQSSVEVANPSRYEELDVPSVQLAVDSSSERVYMLVSEIRPEKSEKEEEEIEALEEKIEGDEEKLTKEEEKLAKTKSAEEKAKLEKEIAELKTEIQALEKEQAALEAHESFDYGLSAAAELYGFGFTTSAASELPQKLHDSAKALDPLSEEHETPILKPSGIAVDPATHDVVILGQEEKGANPEEAEEELLTVVQRVHTTKNEDMGPRYIDSADCLDEGERFEGTDSPCAKHEKSEEYPASPIVSAEGRVYVEDKGAAGEVWEVPAREDDSESFKTVGAVRVLSTSPKRLFTLPAGATWLKFEQDGLYGSAGLMSLAPGAPGTGSIYVLASIPGGGVENHAVVVLSLAEKAEATEVKETGWTAGESPVGAPQPECGLPVASLPLELAGSGEDALVLDVNHGGLEQAKYADLLKFGPEGEPCGSPEVKPPTVVAGEDKNATEATEGEAVELTSAVSDANAISTEWKFKYTSGSEKGEEAHVVEGFQGQRTLLTHSFEHVGEYEITEIVTTDNLATPTVTAVRKGLTVKVPPEPLKVAFLKPAPVVAGEPATFKAHLSDHNESPLHLKYTWNFHDGTVVEAEEQSTKPELTLTEEHTFATPGAHEVTLVVEDGTKTQKPVEEKLVITVEKSKEERAQEEKAREEKAQQEKAQQEKAQQQKEQEEKAKQNVLPSQTVANPEAKLASTSIDVSASGALTVKVTCPAGETSCIGTVTLRTLSAVSAGPHKKKAILTLASGPFTVVGGQAKAVTLHLSAQARALLGSSHVMRALASLVAHDVAGVTRTVKTDVTLRLLKPSHAKH